jgi:hypothetical protein
MAQSTKDILRRVETWPAEDQQELADIAHEIEARRAGVYMLTDAERAAVEQGLAEMHAGKFADEQHIAAIYRKARLAKA